MDVFQSNRITVVHFPRCWTLQLLYSNYSRLRNVIVYFCIVNTLAFFFLFLQNVDHKMKFRSNKGQLPFVEFNGAEIADSAVIIKELGGHLNTDMDAHLTSEQRNVAHATVTMLENHFHW